MPDLTEFENFLPIYRQYQQDTLTRNYELGQIVNRLLGPPTTPILDQATHTRLCYDVRMTGKVLQLVRWFAYCVDTQSAGNLAVWLQYASARCRCSITVWTHVVRNLWQMKPAEFRRMPGLREGKARLFQVAGYPVPVKGVDSAHVRGMIIDGTITAPANAQITLLDLEQQPYGPITPPPAPVQTSPRGSGRRGRRQP